MTGILDWLSRITLTCFTASYALALALELARLCFRLPAKHLWRLVAASAGLFAHAAYLWTLVRLELESGRVPLASWYDWCLLAAMLMAVVHLVLALQRPQNAFGVFLLPLVLSLIGVAAIFRSAAPFSRDTALTMWGVVHGLTVLTGTVVVVFGFAAGAMYLVQSYRLKHKLPPGQRFTLPSLEWLQNVNRLALQWSTLLLAIGLGAGAAINLLQRSVPWSNPVVVSSAALLIWLLASSVFELAYRPARQGRKVAYLTVASFVFLALVLAFTLYGQHALPPRTGATLDSLDWRPVT